MGLVQVQPQGSDWTVKLDGEQQGSRYPTQAEADSAGRQLAKQQQVEYQLHGTDGQIREKDSYGNDPASSKG